MFLSLHLYLNRSPKPQIVGLEPDPDDDKHKFTNRGSKPLTAWQQVKIIRIDDAGTEALVAESKRRRAQ